MIRRRSSHDNNDTRCTSNCTSRIMLPRKPSGSSFSQGDSLDEWMHREDLGGFGGHHGHRDDAQELSHTTFSRGWRFGRNGCSGHCDPRWNVNHVFGVERSTLTVSDMDPYDARTRIIPSGSERRENSPMSSSVKVNTPASGPSRISTFAWVKKLFYEPGTGTIPLS